MSNTVGRRLWSKHELRILTRTYARLGLRKTQLALPLRTRAAILAMARNLGLLRPRPTEVLLTKTELATLRRELRNGTPIKEIKRRCLPHISEDRLFRESDRHGLQRTRSRKWDASEIRLLRATYESLGLVAAQCAFPHRTPTSIIRMVADLNLRTRVRKPPVAFSEAELRCLREMYPVLGLAAVAAAFPERDPRSIAQKARNLGLKHRRGSESSQQAAGQRGL